MSSTESQRQPVAGRLREKDAGTLVRDLNAHTGSHFTYLGMAELGETNGAVFVQWPDGRHSVLTRTRYPIEHLNSTAEIVELARAHGIPAPRYELITKLRDWTILVQERLPGTPPSGGHIDLPMMEAILALNESFAELLVHQHDVPTIEVKLSTRVADTGVGRYAALDDYNDRTSELLARIREIHETSDAPMTGDDLVHSDFSPPNILFDENGNLTGIVDWHDHRLSRGDRRYSLVPLRFELAWAIARGWITVDPAALRRLDQTLDTIDPATLRLYWTHPSLGLIDEMIREGRHTELDYLLTIAWSRLR